MGGAIEAGTQLYKEGKVTNWKAVGGSALQGAVTGAAAGFTGGASLLATVSAAGVANGVGGAINNAVQGKRITVKSITKDVMVGGAFGAAGYGLNKFITSTVSKNVTEQSVTNKLTGYLLNKDHPVGGSKAKWFKEALGFTQENSAELAKQIKFNSQTAVFQKNNGYGDLFQQVIPIKGANDKIINTPFNWIIKNGSNTPELVGALPVKQK